MFSIKEKQFIAAQIEKILLDLKHPDISTEKPVFRLHVSNNKTFTCTDIEPNWKFTDENLPTVNLFTEVPRGMYDYD